MRFAACTSALLLSLALGCSDRATIGGLCLDACEPSDCDAGACPAQHDAGPLPAPDSCAADGCAAADDAGPSCRPGTYALTRKPLAWVMVLDETASISPWWPVLYDGWTQFLQSDAASGLGVGLQLFDEVCDAQHYVTPLVPIGSLPGNAPALQQALPALLSASTSTIPALNGALQYARSWALTHPDGQTAVVLMTDATPGACDGLSGNYEGEAQRIAREAFVGTPSIPTFVIAFSVLQTAGLIARAGGTDPVTISIAPAASEVLAALTQLRGETQPCAFQWPSGWTLAPDSSVVAVASDGSERRYPIHRDMTGCEQGDGFYVEDATASYPLAACTRTCAGLQATDTLALSSVCSRP